MRQGWRRTLHCLSRPQAAKRRQGLPRELRAAGSPLRGLKPVLWKGRSVLITAMDPCPLLSVAHNN